MWTCAEMFERTLTAPLGIIKDLIAWRSVRYSRETTFFVSNVSSIRTNMDIDKTRHTRSCHPQQVAPNTWGPSN